jgi:hypothetical protein
VRPTAQIAARRLRPGLTKKVALRTDAYFRGFLPRIEAHVAPKLGGLVDRFGTKEVGTSLDQAVEVSLRTFGWDAEARTFLSTVRPAIELVGASATDAVGAELGLDVSFDLFARKPVLDDVATRIRSIPETSRDAIRRLIGEGIEKGLSVEQIVRGVPPGTSNVRGPVPEFAGIRGLVDSWSSTGTGRILGGGTAYGSRSYLVALTETASAWNVAATESYRASGIGFVEVFDGPDCGWSRHDDPDLAHGSIRSLAEAKAQPLSHPRCQRAFGAAVNAENARPSPFASRRPTEVPGASPGVRAISAEFRDQAEQYAAAAAAREPAISASLERIRADVGAEFEGFAQRLKAPIRIAEKAQSDAELLGLSSEEAIGGINDSLRYTFNLAERDYTAGIQATIRRLAEEGINLARKADGTPRLKNFWTGDGYQGVNAIFEDASGVRFELQFGTPAQAAVKVESHALYEELRVLSPGDARIGELERRIVDLWAPLHSTPPRNIANLVGWLARFLG